MSSLLQCFIILQTLTISTVSSARILFVPIQFRSMIHTQLRLGSELVARGHDVAVAVGSRFPEPEKTIGRLGIAALTFHVPDDVLYMVSDDYERRLGSVIFGETTETPADFDAGDVDRKLAEEMLGVFERECEYMMQDATFTGLVSEWKFDIAVVDAIGLAPCTLLLPQRSSVSGASYRRGSSAFRCRRRFRRCRWWQNSGSRRRGG